MYVTLLATVIFFCMFQIDREVRDLKEGEEEAEGHGSGTESEKDARQAQVRPLTSFEAPWLEM